MIGLFAAATIAAIVLHLPETVSAPFVLAPVHGADPVRAMRSGIVVEARVVEGQPVSKGEPVFVIRSRDIGSRVSEQQSLESELKNSAGRLADARQKRASERLSEAEESRRLETQRSRGDQMIGLKKAQLSLANEQMARAKKLLDAGLMSRADYADYEVKTNQAALELQQLETSQRDIAAALEKLRHESNARDAEFREIERSLVEASNRSRYRLGALTADLPGSAGGDFAVTAPCAGVVLRLSAQRSGAVVQEGDVLCELSCSGERLQAELRVPQEGLALVKPGQPVKLLYDAFPYQRYGVRYGTVRWTSPAGVNVKDAPAFRVFVQLADEAVVVNGQSRPLLAGMAGTARVIVGSRSLIAYAFEPLRQLRENMAGAPRSTPQDDVK